MKPNGALQSWTEGINNHYPNPYGYTTYGGIFDHNGNRVEDNKYDFEMGTIMYHGIERYGIALGPLLQNPSLDLNQYRPNGDYGDKLKIDPHDMAYGTCVDVGIQINNKMYYIPAIIVDMKEHTWDNGIVQTGESISGSSPGDSKGAIVEWYTNILKNNDPAKNKNFGLSAFDRNIEIRIYDNEVLW